MKIRRIDNNQKRYEKGVQSLLPKKYKKIFIGKQRRPSAFQTMNCTPADYRLQNNVGQTTDRNRAMLPSLFGMKFTQVATSQE